jgi:hypothetical protein
MWRVITILVVGAVLVCLTAMWAASLRRHALEAKWKTEMPLSKILGSRINHERIRGIERATGIDVWKPYLAAQEIAEAGFRAADTQEVAAMTVFFERLSKAAPGTFDDDARRDLPRMTKWNKIMAKFYCDESLYRLGGNWFELRSAVFGTTPNEEIEWVANLLLPAVWSDDVEKAAVVGGAIASVVAYGDGRPFKVSQRRYIISPKRREELRQLLLYEMKNARTPEIRDSISSIWVRAGFTNDMPTNVIQDIKAMQDGVMGVVSE